jgi:hypothetical protein
MGAEQAANNWQHWQHFSFLRTTTGPFEGANRKLETHASCKPLQFSDVTSCQLQPFLCSCHITGHSDHACKCFRRRRDGFLLRPSASTDAATTMADKTGDKMARLTKG